MGNVVLIAAGACRYHRRRERSGLVKSIWNGAITFGLITIPVRMFSTVEEKSLRFNQLHAADNGRIRYKRTCSQCGEEVPWDQIVKGYEVEKETYIVFTEEELERLPSDSIRSIDIVAFVPLDEIDPVYFQRSYYLSPEPTGRKAYALLEQALGQSRRVGIAKVTLREKEYLATLRTRDGVFILETMYWPDEIRPAAFEELENPPEVRPQELAMAETLIESLSDHFDPTAYVDTYRVRLEEAVAAKLEGQEVAVAPQEAPTAVVDLMEALKASVDAVRAQKDQKDQKGSSVGDGRDDPASGAAAGQARSA
jgi:DNA end-binding protein Ku